MKVIIVTGTPASGKTTVAKAIAKKTGYHYVDVKKLIKEHGLSEGFDKERDCDVVDEDKLSDFIVNKVIKGYNRDLVIDSHLSHFVPSEHVDVCVVTTCDLEELKKRLEARGYSYTKIKENMMCEIMEIIPEEAREKGHNIMFVDTSKDVDSEIDKIKVL